MAEARPNGEVPTATYGVGLGLSALGALIFALATRGDYKKYCKAKKLYKTAKECEHESVSGATGTQGQGVRLAMVQGTIKANTKTEVPTPVARIRYGRGLGRDQGNARENKLDQQCSNFELVDSKASMPVYPSSKTQLLHLSHKTEANYPWYVVAASTLAGTGVVFGEEEYLAYDGDTVTLFGKLRFDTVTGRASLCPTYISSSGPVDIIEAIEQNYGISSTVGDAILMSLCIGCGIYCGYKLFYRRRDQQ